MPQLRLALAQVNPTVGDLRGNADLVLESARRAAEAGTPVVLHAGSGPIQTAYTGPGPVAELLARHPRLALVIAHMGAPEYGEFLAQFPSLTDPELVAVLPSP